MQQTKIYEIKGSADPNYKILLDPEGKFFFWNDTRFRDNTLGDYVFVVNRYSGEALFTELAELDIPVTYDENADVSVFNYNGREYAPKGQWEKFIRFDIKERNPIPEGWNWKKIIGQNETYALWSTKKLNKEPERIDKIDDLEIIFKAGEAHRVLENCRKLLSGEQIGEELPDKKEYMDTAKEQGLPQTGALSFNDPFRSVIMAIKTKPFVILAGLSGVGKSRLVRTLAYKSCSNTKLQHKAGPGNFQIIQVKPNWHDSSELLGHETRMTGKFEYSIKDFLRFIVKAWLHRDIPFFLCLDEMNLAPVEQYFAEYLSILESRRFHNGTMYSDPFISSDKVRQYAQDDHDFWKKLGIADKGDLQEEFIANGIGLPPNLVVMGTVNVDETTRSFSRKVLDRAMTIEMNDINLKHGLEESNNDWDFPEVYFEKDLLLGTLCNGYEVYSVKKDMGEEIISELERINEKLKGSPFLTAYRVRDEILIYCLHNSTLRDLTASEDYWLHTCLDEMILMKILSRIEGDESRCRKVINDLLDMTRDKFPKSNQKLQQMKVQLDNLGYTSPWN
jgi:energy-coupling factor transporter ATP-binding protein EcfA2